MGELHLGKKVGLGCHRQGSGMEGGRSAVGHNSLDILGFRDGEVRRDAPAEASGMVEFDKCLIIAPRGRCTLPGMRTPRCSLS